MRCASGHGCGTVRAWHRSVHRSMDAWVREPDRSTLRSSVRCVAGRGRNADPVGPQAPGRNGKAAGPQAQGRRAAGPQGARRAHRLYRSGAGTSYPRYKRVLVHAGASQSVVHRSWCRACSLVALFSLVLPLSLGWPISPSAPLPRAPQSPLPRSPSVARLMRAGVARLTDCGGAGRGGAGRGRVGRGGGRGRGQQRAICDWGRAGGAGGFGSSWDRLRAGRAGWAGWARRARRGGAAGGQARGAPARLLPPRPSPCPSRLGPPCPPRRRTPRSRGALCSLCPPAAPKAQHSHALCCTQGAAPASPRSPRKLPPASAPQPNRCQGWPLIRTRPTVQREMEAGSCHATGPWLRALVAGPARRVWQTRTTRTRRLAGVWRLADSDQAPSESLLGC